jgi:hypothetical protein
MLLIHYPCVKKFTLHVSLIALTLFTYSSIFKTDPVKNIKVDELNKSGYGYTFGVSKMNSKYSEIASTIFKKILVIVSSKKIGSLRN